MAQHLGQPGDVGQAHAAAAAAGADRRPLVHQRRERHGPALVDVAEAVVVGHPHLVEEHLVEGGAAGHLAQRPHLDAGRVHVDDEAGEALVLGQVGVGAADDLADVGVLGARGPHLLAGDDPLVAVALGLGLQAGEVGAGARLAEQLAADEVAAVHRRAGTSPSRGRWAWARIVGATMPRPMPKKLWSGTSYSPSSAAVEPVVARRAARGRRTPSAPVIQPRPASKRLARHALASARSRCSCSRSTSSNRATSSSPSPHTNFLSPSSRFGAGVGVEERPALGLELLDGGLVGHVVHPLVAADAT